MIDLSYKPKKHNDKKNHIPEAIILVIFGALFAWMFLAACVGRINIF